MEIEGFVQTGKDAVVRRVCGLGKKRTLGTQVLGVHPFYKTGIGRIQRVCWMQTRFRQPQLPPL